MLVYLLISYLSAVVLADTYHVDVGRTGLTFNPNIMHNIAMGDILNFHFYPKNHSVAESTFDSPCKPKSGGVDDKPIYSGFVPVDNGVASQMWSMTINTTDPIWLYCSQGDHQHCRNGQAMVINPLNGTDQTLDAYLQAALNANVSSPDEVYGGSIVNDDGGQAQQGSKARPTSSIVASTTAGNTIKPTSGVGLSMLNHVWELAGWGLLVVVFFLDW